MTHPAWGAGFAPATPAVYASPEALGARTGVGAARPRGFERLTFGSVMALADDVTAAVEKHRRERSIGLSEAVNDVVRAGLTGPCERVPFRQKTHDLGEGIDVSNIADAIETLDGPAAR